MMMLDLRCSSRIYLKKGVRPEWAKPYKLHTTTDGITIAFIGLTVAYPEFYQMLDWHIEDPIEHLESILEEVRDEAHITVVLSHLGKVWMSIWRSIMI